MVIVYNHQTSSAILFTEVIKPNWVVSFFCGLKQHKNADVPESHVKRTKS